MKTPKLIHGGSVTPGHARYARPLCTKRPIHLVMRSSRATGLRSFLSPKHRDEIEKLLRKHADACGVKIYDFANGGNHLHLLVKIAKPKLFKNFLRIVTGLIARLILKAEKANAKLGPTQKFWDARPFTRVAAWGKAYEYLKSYLTLNKLEALGFVVHQPRKSGNRKLYSIKVEPFVVGRRFG